MLLSHATTNETIQRDLLLSLLKTDFEDRGLCAHRSAEKMAHLCVALCEPESYDAATWKAAERLYELMDPEGHRDIRLISRPLATRAAFLSLAWQMLAMWRLALEGGVPRPSLEQAYADLVSHKAQLAARR